MVCMRNLKNQPMPLSIFLNGKLSLHFYFRLPSFSFLTKFIIPYIPLHDYRLSKGAPLKNELASISAEMTELKHKVSVLEKAA